MKLRYALHEIQPPQARMCKEAFHFSLHPDETNFASSESKEPRNGRNILRQNHSP
jgi:hypothetical protein